MSSGHTVTITPTDQHVEVRLGDHTLAVSDHPVLLDETGLPTRYYLPRDDIDPALLKPTTFSTTCPFKGNASYWSVELDGTVHDGIAWSYEAPIEAAVGITGMVCFYPERTELIVSDPS